MGFVGSFLHSKSLLDLEVTQGKRRTCSTSSLLDPWTRCGIVFLVGTCCRSLVKIAFFSLAGLSLVVDMEIGHRRVVVISIRAANFRAEKAVQHQRGGRRGHIPSVWSIMDLPCCVP
jgi:hypothetical protein